MRIAIIGAGVSGLVAAHLLHDAHDVTVFEAAAHAGGHAHTVDVAVGGRSVPVDTGFVVFNEVTYPRFTALLERLGVDSRPTTMSFSVRCESTGLEYCGTSLDTFYAQRSNLLRPSFHRMALDILRFNRESKRLLEDGLRAPTMREYLIRGGYGRMFVEKYILPMGSAIWSSGPERILDFPASFFLRFFDNHGLLTVNRHHPWRVIRGGSRSYVEALIRPFRQRIRLGSPIAAVRRESTGVVVRPRGGNDERFDHVVFAAHGDRVLRMLEDPSDAEREILGAFGFQRNDAVLHTDELLLPRRRRARASWNYHISPGESGRVVTTYDMSRLQSLDTPVPICLTLNHTDRIDPSKVLRRMEFWHPFFTVESVRAQARHSEISGVGRTHFCGAYWGNGFHEDGVRSAFTVCSSIRREVAAA